MLTDIAGDTLLTPNIHQSNAQYKAFKSLFAAQTRLIAEQSFRIDYFSRKVIEMEKQVEEMKFYRKYQQ
jgi:hypothetical protein